MLAYTRVSDATREAWRCREYAIASRRDNNRRALCNAWANPYSPNSWPAVEILAQPKIQRKVTSSALSDRDQQTILTSDEDSTATAHLSHATSSPFKVLRIEPIGNNSRRIVVAIPIDAPLDALWSVLTDYEHLADFIPGLSVCKIEDRWENGARLFQVGEQNLALGLKFKATGVINVKEHPVDILSYGICRRIDFEMIEGDFKIFKGTWQMQQESNEGLETTDSSAVADLNRQTLLTYILDVQPKIWLPVGLVEGILSREIQNNLVCIRDEVVRIHTALCA